jgi:hypothetical protein
MYPLDVPQLPDQRSSGTVNDEATSLDAQATADNIKATPTILSARVERRRAK